MKVNMFGGIVFFAVILACMPVDAARHAILPAYAYVSSVQSSMVKYKNLLDKQNRAAARQLLSSRKVFISPRDIKVEVVCSKDAIAKVRLEQLNEQAEPVALYFWTLADQLKFLP